MLTLLQSSSFRRAGAGAKGPEYHGPCPVCGGEDRFHVWPEQNQTGTWWCRQCGKGGDLIEFYRWRDGLSYREACERAGQTPRESSWNPTTRRPRADSWTPAAPSAPAARWSEHAAKLVRAAANRLQETPHVLSWLARRGIDAATAYTFELGWLPTDEWRARESWGLPTETKPDGRAKKLWLPAGLVIPFRDPSGETGEIIRLRIRRDNPDPRYYIVPGSSREPLITMPAVEAWVVVESELDAIALAAACADLPHLGIAAMGNSTARPTESLHADLQAALHISVALDNDPPKTEGGHDGPGATAAKWWLERYPQARRTPPVGGKDPGEMFAAGHSLRDWVLAGLPPRFQPAPTPPSPQGDAHQASLPEGGGREAAGGSPAPAPEPEPIPDPGIPHALPSGRIVMLACDREEWEALALAGTAVFSRGEMERLRPVFAGMKSAERSAAAELLADVKEVFPGAYIAASRAEAA